MKKEVTTTKAGHSTSSRPPMTPEAHENLCAMLAMNLAEEQLRNGTASAQVISYFLKVGSKRERIERETLELQKDLIVAKTDNLHAQQNMDEMYIKAIDAMKSYTPNASVEEMDEDDEY